MIRPFHYSETYTVQKNFQEIDEESIHFTIRMKYRSAGKNLCNTINIDHTLTMYSYDVSNMLEIKGINITHRHASTTNTK